MSGHTPGPWEHEHRTANHKETGLTIAVCEPVSGGRGPTSNPINRRTITEEECIANARLIASAPELLEACKAALAAMVVEGVHTETQELVREAIAKAEGK